MYEIADVINVRNSVIAPALNAASAIARSIGYMMHMIAGNSNIGTVNQDAIRSVARDLEVSDFNIAPVTAESGTRSQAGSGDFGTPLHIRYIDDVGRGCTAMGGMPRAGIGAGGNMYCSACSRQSIGSIKTLARGARHAAICIISSGGNVELRASRNPRAGQIDDLRTIGRVVDNIHLSSAGSYCSRRELHADQAIGSGSEAVAAGPTRTPRKVSADGPCRRGVQSRSACVGEAYILDGARSADCLACKG